MGKIDVFWVIIGFLKVHHHLFIFSFFYFTFVLKENYIIQEARGIAELRLFISFYLIFTECPFD